MSRILSRVALLVAVLWVGWYLAPSDRGQVMVDAALGEDVAAERPLQAAAHPEDAVRVAFEAQARGRMTHAQGRVERILADDRDGSPHQRFIIRTVSGISLLIAHNLDLAPRLEGLAVGEVISAYGEYEWNDKGGVLHWTHDDPGGRHETGYVEWRGRRYQ